MAITVECRSCGKRYKVDDKFAGKRGKCKNCGAAVSVPAAPVAARLEPEDPFAAMEELERTGKVSEDVPFATAALPLPAVTAAAPAAPPRARGTVYNPQLATAAKANRYGAMPQEAGPTSVFWLIVGPPGVNFWIFAGLLVLGVLSLVTLTTSRLFGLPLLFGGIAFVVIGGLWFRILGWQHGHTFPYTWIPGADFVFALQNFGVMSRPIFCWLRGIVLVAVAFVIILRTGVSSLDRLQSQRIGPRAVAQGTQAADESSGEGDDESDSDTSAKPGSTAAAPPGKPDVEVPAPAVIKPFPPPDPMLVDQLAEPVAYGWAPYMIPVPKNFNMLRSFTAPKEGSIYINWQKAGAGQNFRTPMLSYSIGSRRDKSQHHPRVFTHMSARSELSMDDANDSFAFENAQVTWGSIEGVEFARVVGREGDAAHSIGYLTYVAFDGDYVIHISAQNVSPGTPTFDLLDTAVRSLKRR